MPPSQLKRLKASLREKGVIGPPQSKKQKKKSAIAQKHLGDRVLRKSAVVDSIREQFNPFDVKRHPRGPKFEVVTSQQTDKKNVIKGRPGASRAAGEEKVETNAATACFNLVLC